MKMTKAITNNFEHAEVNSSAATEMYFVAYPGAKYGDLYVRYTGGTGLAGYSGVPRVCWGDLLSGHYSVGRYLNRYIKNQYTGISGDVVFTAPAEEVAKPVLEQGNKVSVYVRVDGTLRFDFDGVEVNEALVQVNQMLNKSLVDPQEGSAIVEKVELHYV